MKRETKRERREREEKTERERVNRLWTIMCRVRL